EPGLPPQKPGFALGLADMATVEMECDAAHIIGQGEWQAAAEDEIRDAAFEGVRREADEIRVGEQIEADLLPELLIAIATGDLAEAAADESRSVVRPRPVAHAFAIDEVHQLDPELRIVGGRANLPEDIRLVAE